MSNQYCLGKKIINQICKDAFPDKPVRLDVFGSLATGLALESSDMDLVITGLRIDGRDDVIQNIMILKSYFNNYECFTNIKAIESASIPVIKLEADLEIVRKSENSKSVSKIDARMRYLQIDITFEDSRE